MQRSPVLIRSYEEFMQLIFLKQERLARFQHCRESSFPAHSIPYMQVLLIYYQVFNVYIHVSIHM